MSEIQLRRKSNQFVDISLSFEPNPITKDINVLKNERAINNSLKNLVMIVPKEVPFRWDVGSSVTDFLFELAGDSTDLMLQREIERTIEYNEPRVELLEVNVDGDTFANEIRATIIYKIIGYDEVFTVTQILKPTD